MELGRSERTILRPLLRPLLSQGVDVHNTPIETALTEAPCASSLRR
jgi:hypothetical protein